jgi:glutathione S-transferase
MPPSLKLYDREASGNAYKVRLLLAFLRLPHDTIPVALKDGRNLLPPEYQRLNPRGQIPTLLDGDTTLWGSTAILCYLAARYDTAGTWLPHDPARLGAVMQWLELAQNEVMSGLAVARVIQRFGVAGDLQAAQRLAVRALEVLESRLAAASWLAGDAPTLADVACFPYAALAAEGGVDATPYPGVQAWIARFKALPGFVPMPGIS